MTSPIDYRQMPAQELHAMCLAGGNDAWGYVYGYVLAVARWPKWGLKVEAEDLAQDVVLKLMENGIRQVREPAAFRGFIKRVAVNRILDRLRVQPPPAKSLDAPVNPGDPDSAPFELPGGGPLPEDDAAGRQVFAAVGRAIAGLPENCRRVLPHYFRFRLGLIASYKELARILGKTVGTVSAQVHRCLAQLAQVPEIAALSQGT